VHVEAAIWDSRRVTECAWAWWGSVAQDNEQNYSGVRLPQVYVWWVLWALSEDHKLQRICRALSFL
jgi:hypothetical protein